MPTYHDGYIPNWEFTDVDQEHRNAPLTQIELSFACRNLINLDFFSKTDAQIFVYAKNGRKYTQIGHTMDPNVVKIGNNTN